MSAFLDGYRIRWRRLGLTVIGASILAYFEGVVRVILAVFEFLLAFPRGFASFAAAVIGVVIGLPGVILDRGFAAAVPFVLDAGVAGFVVAISIVLATIYVFRTVVSRVR